VKSTAVDSVLKAEINNSDSTYTQIYTETKQRKQAMKD